MIKRELGLPRSAERLVRWTSDGDGVGGRVDTSDEFILRILSSTQGLSAMEAKAVGGWWLGERGDGETMLEFLMRQGVFSSVASKTLDMMRKGYIKFADARHLFNEGGVETLRRGLEQPAGAAAPVAPLGLMQSSRDDLTLDRMPASTRAVGANPTVVRSFGQDWSGTGPVKPTLAAPASSSGRGGRLLESSRRIGGLSPMASHERADGRTLEIGSVLGKCLLTELVGQGASGVVYRALHKTLNIPVAVKVLQIEGGGVDPAVVLQFRAEARLLARLSHPNIVRVLDFEDDVRFPYLVLEYVEGLSLAELISQSGRVRTDRAVRVIVQICEGLSAARKLGVVHRDVKPANILLGKEGSAKLADLGLAVVVDGRLDAPAGMPQDMMAGTAAYMAPEQALASSVVDHRSDVYALGVTFYHAVTGQLPFKGSTRMEVMLKHAQEPPAPPHRLASDLDVGVSAVILRMMAKDPASRFQSYEDLIDVLTKLPSLANSTRGLVATSSNGSTMGNEAEGSNNPRRSLWRNLFAFSRRPEDGREATA